MQDTRGWDNTTPEDRKNRMAAATRARKRNSALRRINNARQQILDDTALIASLDAETGENA